MKIELTPDMTRAQIVQALEISIDAAVRRMHRLRGAQLERVARLSEKIHQAAMDERRFRRKARGPELTRHCSAKVEESGKAQGDECNN